MGEDVTIRDKVGEFLCGDGAVLGPDSDSGNAIYNDLKYQHTHMNACKNW